MHSRVLVRILACLVLLAAAVHGGGCATRPRVEWAKRVGLYTYDDAVKDYGPPDKKETTSDGTVVAEWVVRRGQVYGMPGPGWGMGIGYRRYGPWGWYGAGATEIHSTPDEVLRLQFGTDARLQSWKEYLK